MYAVMQLSHMQTPVIRAPSPIVEGVGLDIYIKREDLNPSGSHKDRALFPYVDKLVMKGEKAFCLSSSGNFAISAAYYARHHPQVQFHLFSPPTISQEKKDRLNEYKTDNVIIHWSKLARSEASQFSRKAHIRLLRGSKDDYLLEGYDELARELVEQTEGKGGSVFMAVSSGTMLAGLWEGFRNIVGTGRDPSLPSLHIVQTTKVYPIAREFDQDFTPSKVSIASAIVDRVANRKDQVVKAVKESHGSGWIVSDEEITSAMKKLAEVLHENVSPESAMSLAGLHKACAKGFRAKEPIALIFTGK